MKLILQRVHQASVAIEGKKTAEIGHGLLLLIGISNNDTLAQASYLASRVSELRIFRDGTGKMNRNIRDSNGSILVVPNFTLYGDCSRGRRPSFARAAHPAAALTLYNYFTGQLRTGGSHVETGIFGADMQVALVNDGPVTFVLEAEHLN